MPCRLAVAASPSSWGPCFWETLFRLAASLPYDRAADNVHTFHVGERDSCRTRSAVRQAILALAAAIPCAACRSHFQEYVQQNRLRKGSASDPGPLFDPQRCVRWVWHAKDDVNRRTGRHSPSLSSVTRRYCGAAAAPTTPTTRGAAAADRRR